LGVNDNLAVAELVTLLEVFQHLSGWHDGGEVGMRVVVMTMMIVMSDDEDDDESDDGDGQMPEMVMSMS
jgi:hypothetical protein